MIHFRLPLQEQIRQVRYNSILVDLFSLLVLGFQDTFNNCGQRFKKCTITQCNGL